MPAPLTTNATSLNGTANATGARIAAIVLAAGRSRRMAGVNKLLIPVAGQPMVVRAAAAALDSRARPVLIVVGHQADRVRTALRLLVDRDVDGPGQVSRLAIIDNPSHGEGIAGSIRAGLDALPSGVDGAVFLLADMPWISAGHVDRLIDAFDPAAGQSICVATYQGRRGNPVLWGAAHFPALRTLDGDAGGRVLLAGLADQVKAVAFADPGVVTDVDRPGDLPSRILPPRPD